MITTPTANRPQVRIERTPRARTYRIVNHQTGRVIERGFRYTEACAYADDCGFDIVWP